MHVLDSHDSSSPVLSHLGIVHVLASEVLLEGLEILIIFLSHVSQSNGSCGLLMDELSESGLALHNAEWHILLSAQGREEDNQFNWVDVVGNGNELGISTFDKLSDVAEPVFQGNWLLVILSILASCLLSSLSLKSVSLLLLVLGRILSEEFEELMSCH